MPAITKYIKQLLSYEEYSFSWEELLQKCNTPISTLRKELIRLTKSKDIIKLRKGFYLILPPQYSKFGKLPIQLHINKLFKYLEKKYYVALYSAAAQFGAAHQQIQKDYIITVSPSLRDIPYIRFFKTNKWPDKNIIKKKSDAGFYNISSPFLTSVDLIHYQTKIGGINRMLGILEELTEEMNTSDLNDLLKWYPHKSTLQRLGFLMDELQPGNIYTSILFEHLQKHNFYPVLLSHQMGRKVGKTGNKWKVYVNIKLESDL